MAYEFHYTPTGTGAISGTAVLEQTEDAINDLGNTAISGVQEALDKAQQAFTNSANAVDDAQTALNTANNAEGVAIQAQTDVSNLSGTVTNIGNRVTTAEGNITNLQGRMTTAEGNITNLQGRMTTAESDIGNLQTAVSTAQATANSAQQTATTARQQSYVFRYSSTALVASSTNSNTLLDNTDNLKVGDKVIDSSGVLFSITAIDTANSTFTIGTALIDLAQDSDVVHKSGNETVSGSKRFGVVQSFTGFPTIRLYSTSDDINVLPSYAQQQDIRFTDKNNAVIAYFIFQHRNDADEPFRTCWRQNRLDGTSNYYSVDFNNLGEFYPENNNAIKLGTSLKRWSEVYATNYYYGSNNVEFSTKFVTTDTAQTISGNKTFSNDLNISNTDTTANTPNLNLRNYKLDRGTTDTGVQTITFLDKNAKALTVIESRRTSNGSTGTNILTYNTDDSNNTVSGGVSIIKSKTDTIFAPNTDNAVTCGRALARWSNVQTYKVNGLEPSSLSLPSSSGTIDISSYITDLTGATVNNYTPLANGYIVITCNANDVDYIKISNNLDFVSLVDNTNNQFTSGILGVWQPCIAGIGIQIRIKSSALKVAKFIPCQGNV